MPALDFPNAPLAGQIFTQGSTTWTYDGTKWVASGTAAAILDEVGFACSDTTTPLSVKTGVASIRMPYAMKLSAVRFHVATAPAGAAITADVKCNGTTVFTTRPQIPAGALTSVGSASPGVLATTNLPDDSLITVDVTQVGSTTAGLGLGCWLLGTRA